ncbi:MotA/TolQ/ExbB proton channel family protein [Caballeronia sordidicola]|nr:MotA/TolQ/ExbB proton channel family protein [Caballeronia sordidicola]
MQNLSSAFITQGAMAILIAFSLATWTLIGFKTIQYWRLGLHNKKFARAFWQAPDLNAAAKLQGSDGPLARLMGATVDVMSDIGSRASRDLAHSWDRQDLLERCLRKQIHKEKRLLETGMIVLASIGSTAPFVGLFGTVFGIIHALTSIAKLGSARIDIVAGPIGEALVATGVGIAVAVPAVLAYNFFTRRMKVNASNMDEFAGDLINLAQRNQFVVESSAGARQKASPIESHAALARSA